MVCSYCGMAGHNIRTCPYRSDDYVVDRNNDPFCYTLITTIFNIFNGIITGFNTIFIILSSTNNNNNNNNNNNINVSRYVSVNGRNPIPKCISNQIYENKKEQLDCCICLSNTTKDNFNISNCGHYYCDNCYNDTRLDKCAICRNVDF